MLSLLRDPSVPGIEGPRSVTFLVQDWLQWSQNVSEGASRNYESFHNVNASTQALLFLRAESLEEAVMPN